MELCTSQALSNLPSITSRHGCSTINLIRYTASFPLRRNGALLPGLQSRTLRCTGSFPRETITEEPSATVNDEFGVGKGEEVVAVEDVSPVQKNVTSERLPDSGAQFVDSTEDLQTQTMELLDNVKLDSDNAYSVLLFGSGAILALYVASVIVGSVEAIPLLPKLLEVVGLGYSLWFTTRYLLFKKNREELKERVKEIKQQVLGSDSD